MTSIVENIKTKGKDLSVLEGIDRIQYLVDLAKEVKPLANKHKTEENRIRGCASNLWVIGDANIYNKMYYQFDAEAFITKGTARLVIELVQQQPKDEIAKLTREDFNALGIKELLTAQRQNGLGNLITRIVGLAQ
jgi:cysteine desulfuration protein SufE